MKNLIRKGYTLAFRTTLALSLATTISAQQATRTPGNESAIEASESAETERVIVTGSNTVSHFLLLSIMLTLQL